MMQFNDKNNELPKIIHLFWFGRGKKSELMEKCIASWKEYAPGYEIKEWNEDNFDVNFCKRSRQAYESGKYAFVADIARLKVIYEMGGVYLDTDVELLLPLDDLIEEIRDVSTFFLFHNERFINTGCGFGSIPKANIIGYLLKNYETMNFELKHGIFAQVCTQIETEALEDYYPSFLRNNITQKYNDNTMILSTSKWQKYLIHHGTGTWVDGGREIRNNRNNKIGIFKMAIRSPVIFRNIRKIFGRKAEYIYEFLVYDLLDMGFLYFIKRFLKRFIKQ